RWICSPQIVLQESNDLVESNALVNGFLDSSLDGYGVGYGRLRGSNGALGEALQATGVPKNSNGNGNGHNGRHDILPAVLGAYSNNGDPEREQRKRPEPLPAAPLLRFDRSG